VVLQQFLPAAGCFGLTLLAILALRPVAIAVDLVDRPGGRKTHFGDVPIVGGLAMLLGIMLGGGLLPPQAAPPTAFLAACSVLVTVGLVDDRFEISPWARLAAQVIAALIVIYGTGSVITNLGDLVGTGPILLGGIWSLLFTITVFISAINACNMLDGMDGLAGATALVAFVALAVISSADGLAAMSLVMAATVCAFLLFNLPMRLNRRVHCFMGDAGSTLLGFTVAWLCIQIAQGPSRDAAPVTMLWIVALPLYELIWSTIRRIFRGVSPLKADNQHFHHLLQSAGFGVRGAFGIVVVLAALLAGFGFITHRFAVPHHYSFALFALAGVAVVWLMYRADILWTIVPGSLRRLPRIAPDPANRPHGAGVVVRGIPTRANDVIEALDTAEPGDIVFADDGTGRTQLNRQDVVSPRPEP
jgi:UDP-GlcNAc:undecaprenyl-phosphate GlcNAc-1-phosphate transferase